MRKRYKKCRNKQPGESALPAQQPLEVKCTKASISRRHCYIDFVFFYSYPLYVKKKHTLRIIKVNIKGDTEVFKNDSSSDLRLDRCRRTIEHRKKNIWKGVKLLTVAVQKV